MIRGEFKSGRVTLEMDLEDVRSLREIAPRHSSAWGVLDAVIASAEQARARELPVTIPELVCSCSVHRESEFGPLIRTPRAGCPIHSHECERCGGKGIVTRGKGKDTEYARCWEEGCLVPQDVARKSLAELRVALHPSGRFG